MIELETMLEEGITSPSRVMFATLLVAACAGVVGAGSQSEAAEAPFSGRVTVLRAPGGGIQPQSAIDPSGTIHLVYLAGDPSSSDVRYTQLVPGGTEFAPPLRVNSEPGSAVAMGTIRGAQIAIGRNGRVHVAWNGTMTARPANPNGGSPMLYARSNESRTAFEPQRNLMIRTSALDGGGTIAADGQGKVFVAWQAQSPDVQSAPRTNGESSRAVYVAQSTDDGARFSPERRALDRVTGACPCCGTRALSTADGGLAILFRAATRGVERDILLLNSRDGFQFEGTRVDSWQTTICPMSSASLVLGGKGEIVAAWETKGQVYFARVNPQTGRPGQPIHPRGSTDNRKHPAVAVNTQGEILLAWAEGTSFNQGGSLAWRVFDPSGKSTEESGRIEGGIPRHGLATAVARPDGGFTVIH